MWKALSQPSTPDHALPSAPSHQFKLTREMAELIGGGEHYRWFVDLCVRGFLAVRAHCEDVMAAAALMSRRYCARARALGVSASGWGSGELASQREIMGDSNHNSSDHESPIMVDKYALFSPVQFCFSSSLSCTAPIGVT